MKTKKVDIRKVSVIDLEEALQEAIKEKLITEKEAGAIVEYSQSGDGGSYWEMHWGDIEEENGMSTEEALAFKKIYNKYKEYERTTRSLGYKYILFDVACYS